jgi:hypothetical protein
MLNFLIIESDSRVLDLLTQGLMPEFNANVITEYDFSSIEQIILSDSVDLIIVRNHFEMNNKHVDSAKDLLNLKYDLKKGPPVIVLGDFHFPGQPFKSLSDRFRIEELFRLIVKVLNITPEQIKHFKLPEYVPLAIENFYLMDKACCDFFIKLDSADSEKYIKRLSFGDAIDKEVIEKYQNNKVRNFYVKKKDHPNLLNELLQQSLEKIVNVSKSGKNIHEINSKTFGISQNLIEAIGISSHTVRLANASIYSMVKSIQGHQKMQSLLDELLSNTSSYAYKRNYLVSAMCCEIAPYMEWGSGTQLDVQIEKMTFLSFFHDIFIREEQHLKIFSNQEAKNLDLESCEIVLNHANKAASLIQSFPKTPGGVDLLIKQHHGTTSGVGFAPHYSASISPMAIVFIVLEKYAFHILKYDHKELKKKSIVESIFEDLYEEFNLPSYKKVVKILKKLSII